MVHGFVLMIIYSRTCRFLDPGFSMWHRHSRIASFVFSKYERDKPILITVEKPRVDTQSFIACNVVWFWRQREYDWSSRPISWIHGSWSGVGLRHQKLAPQSAPARGAAKSDLDICWVARHVWQRRWARHFIKDYLTLFSYSFGWMQCHRQSEALWAAHYVGLPSSLVLRCVLHRALPLQAGQLQPAPLADNLCSGGFKSRSGKTDGRHEGQAKSRSRTNSFKTGQKASVLNRVRFWSCYNFICVASNQRAALFSCLDTERGRIQVSLCSLAHGDSFSCCSAQIWNPRFRNYDKCHRGSIFELWSIVCAYSVSFLFSFCIFLNIQAEHFRKTTMTQMSRHAPLIFWRPTLPSMNLRFQDGAANRRRCQLIV